MIVKYDEHIDKLSFEGGSFIQAALLRENRDGLIKLGKDITLKDLK